MLDIATCELAVLVEHVLKVSTSRAARESAHEELIVAHSLPSKRELPVGYKVQGASGRERARVKRSVARDLLTAACAKCKDALQKLGGSSARQVGGSFRAEVSVYVISCRPL